jgi:hypothetical protein
VLVDDFGKVGSRNGGVRTRERFRFRRFHVLPVALHMGRQERVVIVLREAWQQGIQCGLDITNGPDSHRMSPPDVRRIGINLNDSRAIRIELAPGEIRAEQKQHIAVEDGVVAGTTADHAGHPDIVRVVVLDEILAA